MSNMVMEIYCILINDVHLVLTLEKVCENLKVFLQRNLSISTKPSLVFSSGYVKVSISY